MAYNLIIKPQAENDLDNALEWYSEQSEDLSLKLLNELEQSLEKIQNYPEHYQKRYNEIRIVFAKKFLYGVYYTAEENIIYVHAILHSKQNPQNAEQRIK